MCPLAEPRLPVPQVQKEGLGMDKCIEDSKYRMVRRITSIPYSMPNTRVLF